jgi:hypothetical protein
MTSERIQELLEDAKCIDCNIPQGMQIPVLIGLIDNAINENVITVISDNCVIPPAPVLNTITVFGGAIVLHWTQANDPPSGFIIYYGQTQGGPYTNFLIVNDGSARNNGSGPYGAGTWYFVITAKGSQDNCESEYSNELSANM